VTDSEQPKQKQKRSRAGTVLLGISTFLALYSLFGAVDAMTGGSSVPPLLAPTAPFLTHPGNYALQDHLIDAGVFGIAPILAILWRRRGNVRTDGETEARRAGLHKMLTGMRAGLVRASLPERIVLSVAVGVLLLSWAFPQVHFSYYRWMPVSYTNGTTGGEWHPQTCPKAAGQQNA
jgi:hypothetical protein